MNPTALTVLLVEDNLGDQRLVQEMLNEWGRDEFRLLVAGELAGALAMLESERVDLVLLDLRLPDGDGLEGLTRIHARAPTVPVVVLSNTDDEALAVRAVRLGAQDFLVKRHISGALLTRSMRYALERRQLEEHLYHLAHHDVLTGLPNRKLFYERLSRALATARRHRSGLALMLLDLNGFKQINDVHGHPAGDELLRQVATRLRACLRATDCAARLGGDEFVIFASDVRDEAQAERVAQKVLDALAAPYDLGAQRLAVPASVGVAMHPEDGDDIDVLVRHADAAMYQAKEDGRAVGHYRFYARDDDAVAAGRAELREALRQALERGEFAVNYQPQVDLRSGRIIGVEALLRWQHGERLVLPGEFFPALEESGLIREVGEWVLTAACRQVVAWRQEGMPSIKVAVNISPRQFRDSALAERVARSLAVAELDAKWLELEICEDSLYEDEELALVRLGELQHLGVRIALDNFRAQSIPLRDLQRFPIHTIKLDPAIVGRMTDSAGDADMVRAMISVAHVFKIKGVAGGVETAAQADMLRDQAWDDAQGYMFARPLPPEAVARLLARPQAVH